MSTFKIQGGRRVIHLSCTVKDECIKRMTAAGLPKLNSEITFSADLSEKGKNLERNNRILPQSTVFCVLESQRNKSLQIRNRLFLMDK